MFTGIIEEIGTIASLKKIGDGIRIEVAAPKSLKELKINDSVAINGVCQTVVLKTKDSFVVEAVEETLKKTTLGSLNQKTKVNIELPTRLNARLGGHLVLGHVDTVGEIVKVNKKKNSWLCQIRFPKEFRKYTVPIGSIAIDGVSLTIVELIDNNIIVSIIPHTMANTIFPSYKVGTKVNLEFDIIGKYIERFVSEPTSNYYQKPPLSEKDLRDGGF
ncbi:MAG: riboflavin synthase [Bacteroidota bacterium]|nr:riboflavin synthase [Bacteroidota bacterium]